MFLLLGLILITVLVVFLYVKLKIPLQYWKDKGVPYSKPWIIFGNFGPMVFRTMHLSTLTESYYKKFSTRRYFGFFEFSTPTLYVRDLDLIKKICIHDFDKFTDHTDFLPGVKNELMTKSLFFLKGEEWHRMRCILSPAFTSSKMKAMFPLIIECADRFVDYYKKQPGTVTLELRDAFTRFTNDVIASCAFGIKCDSLNDDTNEFFANGKIATNFSGLKTLIFFGASLSPKLMKLLNVQLFSTYIKDFFYRIVKETIDHRKQTGLHRPDLINLLMEAQQGKLPISEHLEADPEFRFSNNEPEPEKRNFKTMELTDEQITSQAMLFFFAGYDSIAVVLCILAYELAINVEVQKKLVKEIDDTINASNGKITYEALTGMKYLDMVISETLRLWSPGVIMVRQCVKPYTIDPVLPGEKPLKLDVGSIVTIPVYSIQRDENYFPNPTKFDPERFSDENKHNIVPGSYFPFGTGPRFCIGNRFALLETKILLVSVLRKFLFVPVAKSEIPFVPRKDNIMFHSKNGFWFGLEHRQ